MRRRGSLRHMLGLAIAMMGASITQAQTRVEGDPADADPVGIVADPCPAHPQPATPDGWRLWNLHMLTRDFGQLCRYRAANVALKVSGQPVRVVFFGDSITDNWLKGDPSLFAPGIVDRGISGQTTAQMLVRFREDVIALHPRAVHILAATNDIAGNTGASTLEIVEGNIQTMAELARAHGIRVMLASIPPAAAFPWSPDKRPAATIVALNGWLRDYAAHSGFAYVDYYVALADTAGGMKPGLSSDGVHPTPRGYAVMKPIAMAAIAKASVR
jgi:lysophospholipase L1-like esterase